MASERRYSEEEVSEILDRATEVSSTRNPTSGATAGLTLSELQEIGREVGIPADVIANAATGLDRPRPQAAPPTRFLGQTIGVGRTLELPRPLSDNEWNQLVVDLRETFNAKGRISSQGAFRQWNNSRLQALLEPTETGERLRLKTEKGNARSFQAMGAAFMGSGLVMGVASLLSTARDPSDVFFLTVMGAGFFFGSRLTVPFWAKTRARQFDEIVERLAASVTAPADGPDRLTASSGDDTDDT